MTGGADARRRGHPLVSALLLGAGVLAAALALGVAVDVPWLSLASSAALTFLPHLAAVLLVLAAAAAMGVARRPGPARATALVLVVGALSGVVVAGAQQWAAAADAGVRIDPARLLVTGDERPPDDRATYRTADGIDLPLAVWEPAGAEPDAPVVLWIHGGGWIMGDETSTLHSGWLADQGHLVVSAGYPLSTERDHLWDVTEDRLGCALVWLREHAAAHGGDPDRIVVAGDSAGGNLALDVAYRANAGDLPTCGGEEEPPRVDAVAALYPVASPAAFYDNRDPALGATAREMAGSYLGGSPEAHPERYESVTPSTHLGPDSPPTLIVNGDSDHLVPPGPSVALAESVAEAGVPIRHVVVPHGEHVMDAAVGGIAGQTWRALADDWIAEHAGR